MKKLFTPFDREIKEVLETINMQCILDIAVSKKSLMEGNFIQIDHKFSSQEPRKN